VPKIVNDVLELKRLLTTEFPVAKMATIRQRRTRRMPSRVGFSSRARNGSAVAGSRASDLVKMLGRATTVTFQRAAE
jgi:hypothetical protein